MSERKRIVICGAAGRDFHNFNVLFKDNPDVEVAAFTATQIPNIEGRIYPPPLSGPLYPEGIPIRSEDELPIIIRERKIDEVHFAYSDVTHIHVMHIGSIVLSEGAAFVLDSPEKTMIRSVKPSISICAVRTGCGKSQTTRAVADILIGMGKKVVAIRHPMPYGNLAEQRVQRFATREDMDRQNCTIEEMEEYEPHIDRGVVVYAGVDYAAILKEAEKEGDVILWDGGNNDTPFIKSDLEIVVTDPHRAGHELAYHPGETNFLRADVVVINKIDSAEAASVKVLEDNIRRYNPKAVVVRANSRLIVDKPELIKGKRVLVVEDGPTLTHGEMKYGAGIVAAKTFEAEAIIDPRPWTEGTITDTFKKYPKIGTLLPAMGYGAKQVKDLETTINRTECDTVIIATPIDLNRITNMEKPTVRVTYELEEISSPGLKEIIAERIFPDG